MHVLHNSIEFLFAFSTALASLSLRVSVFFLRAPGYSAILLVSFIYTSSYICLENESFSSLFFTKTPKTHSEKRTSALSFLTMRVCDTR